MYNAVKFIIPVSIFTRYLRVISIIAGTPIQPTAASRKAGSRNMLNTTAISAPNAAPLKRLPVLTDICRIFPVIAKRKIFITKLIKNMIST